jgi:hypothetical protein
LVGFSVTSSWKVVKGHGLLLLGACEMVVELAISGVEEKLAIRKGIFLRGIGSEKKVSICDVGKSFVGSPPDMGIPFRYPLLVYLARLGPIWRPNKAK